MAAYEVYDKDLGWKKIKRELKKLGRNRVDVGLFDESGGDPSESVAARGAVHEYGSEKMNIPARPFQRQTFEKHRDEVLKLAAVQYVKVLHGRSNIRRLLKVLGAFYAGRMRRMITAGHFVPLKPRTIERKKSSVPLIDTGQMRNSIQYKVRRK